MTISGGAASPFTPARGHDLIAQLRAGGRGAIVVTSGLRDLRLVTGDDEVALESAGTTLSGGDVRDLIRAFLCVLFWEDPIALFVPDAARREDAPAIRARAPKGEVLDQIAQGLTELEPLREKVPSLEVLVTVTGQPPPAGEDAPAARLFRAAAKAPGGVVLALAAEEAGIDAIDAAWAAVDLLEAKQGAVKKLSPTVAMRRLKRAEGLVEEGLHPGLRHEYLARGHARSEPRKATGFLRLAGDAHRFAGDAASAAACYRAALALSPDDPGAREGLVCALAAQGREAEVRTERLELIERYVAAGLPLRARAHLAELGELTSEQQALVLQCLLAAGELTEAADLAERMAPRLPPDERAALADRFARAGAAGPELARAVHASGVARLLPLRRALLAANAVALLALVLVGAEAYGRVELRRATQRATPELNAGRFDSARSAFAELAHVSSRLAADRWPVHTAMAEAGRYVALIDDLAADQALLDASLDRLEWRHHEDVLVADARLEALAAAARSRPLRDLIATERAELAGYRQRVAEEVKRLQDLVIAGNRDALGVARRLVAEYSNARDLFVDRTVTLRVLGSPKTANLSVDGKRVDPLGRDSGEWEVRIRLDGQPVTLALSYDGHVTQTRQLRFQDIEEPEVSFELVALTKEPSLASAWPTWPESSDAPPVRYREDPVSVSRLQANVKGDLALEEGATQARLVEALRVAPEARLSVVAVSEYARRKVILRELRVFLEAGGKRATPFRLDVGRLERPLTDEPAKGEAPARSVLHDLGQVERFPLLLDALREAVGLMQAEVSR